MAAYLNENTIIGELANDPDIRQLGNGNSVCNLRVLTKNTWQDRNTGEEKSRAKYTTVVIFNKDLVALAQQLKAGARVFVRGEPQDRNYQTNGQDKWVTETVVQGFAGVFYPLSRGNGAQASEVQRSGAQPSENMRNAPQRSQTSGQPPVKKSFPGRQSHDFELEDSVPWLDE